MTGSINSSFSEQTIKRPMFLVGLTCSRITARIGQTANLLALQGAFLPTMLKRSPLAVVFFLDEDSDLDFAEYAVRKFNGDLFFFRSNFIEGSRHGCTSYPCTRAFRSGDPITGESVPNTSIEFTQWVSRLFSPGLVPLTAPEELRRLFESDYPSVIGVDIDAPPGNAPKDKPFHIANSSLFAPFGLSVSRGTYVYRPADRQFLPLTVAYDQAIVAGIPTSAELDLADYEFFAGFSINTSLDDLAEKEIELVKQLRSSFDGRTAFANIHGNTATVYETTAQLEALTKPYFFVLNAADVTAGRWFIADDIERMHNLDELKRFVDRVIAGKEEYSIVSQPVVPEDTAGPLKKVVGLNADEWIINNKKDALVAVVGPSLYTRMLLQLLNETAKILSGVETLDVIVIEGPANDIPDYVPTIESYPVVYLWPSGKKDAPKQYTGPRKIEKLMEFLTASVTSPFEVPEYNATEVEEKIRLVIRPARKSAAATETK
jgi:hypothetical protein